jgi:hypothetical protein
MKTLRMELADILAWFGRAKTGSRPQIAPVLVSYRDMYGHRSVDGSRGEWYLRSPYWR